jgi:uncharacterized protein YjbJ (UPF0337 family)
MQIGRIDLTKLRGIGDKALGLAKEAFGVLTSNDRWQDEGMAQQERASAELKALREEMRAEGHEAAATASEKRQRAAQRAKAS